MRIFVLTFNNFLRKARKLGLRLAAAKLIANMLGLPNLAGFLVTWWRLGMRPLELIKRRRLARTFLDAAGSDVSISKTLGYYKFSGCDFTSDIDSVVDVCNQLLDDKGRENLDTYYQSKSKSGSKSFFYNLLQEGDLYDYPQIMDFILGDRVLNLIIPYYGMIPRLCSVGLYYSPIIKGEREGSQNFHIDGTDPRHVKCFINVSDVGPNDGPFTFIPADRSGELRMKGGGMLRSAGLENKALLRTYEKDYGIRLTGGPGGGAFVDTSRCLHFGSVCEQNPRIVLMFHYSMIANYTKIEENPLRDLRMQHYPKVREYFGKDKVREAVLKMD